LKINIKIPLFYIIVCAVPLLWLFNINAAFRSDSGNSDWERILWFSQYHASYFRKFFWFPELIQSKITIGLNTHLFYGFLIFPFLGLASTIYGAAIGLRIILVIVSFIQAYAIRNLIRYFINNKFLADCVSVTFIWSIYSLTNLYARQAIFEFIATKLLSTAIAFYLIGIKSNHSKYIIYSLALLVVILGTHPTTFILSFLTLIPLITVTLNKVKNYYKNKTVILSIVTILIIILPLVALNLSKTGNSINIRNLDEYKNGMKYFYNRSDSISGKLNIIPYDQLFSKFGKSIQAPHLDTQISAGLLILVITTVIYIIYKKIRLPKINLIIILFFCIYISSIFYISIKPSPIDLVNKILGNYVQFGYRLTEHINLLLLIFVLYIYSNIGLKLSFKFSRNIGILLLSLLLISTCIKLFYSYDSYYFLNNSTYFKDSTYEITYNEVGTSTNFNSSYDYATTKLYKKFDPTQFSNNLCLINITNLDDRIEATQLLNLDKDMYVITNVEAYPWNQLLIDTKKPIDLYVYNSYLVILIPKGLHSITYKINIPHWYDYAFKISRLLLLVTILCIPVLIINYLIKVCIFRTPQNIQLLKLSVTTDLNY